MNERIYMTDVVDIALSLGHVTTLGLRFGFHYFWVEGDIMPSISTLSCILLSPSEIYLTLQ
jgi:hypothetical protein